MKVQAGECSNIMEKLAKKYDRTFNFFQVKPINEITYDQTLKITCIAFKDVAYLLDQNQYLKRYYFLSNKANRNQIAQRIKMLAEFYHNNLVLKYEYPTMIVTNTKNIFMKKLRRMKKMVANDNSSQDSSEENSQIDMSFESSGFLKSIDTEKPISASQQSSQKMVQNLSFETDQVYKIYDNPQEIFNIQYIKEDQTHKNLKDIGVSHLVCDFDEVDTDYIFAMYKKANKKVEEDKNRQRLKKKITFNQINSKNTKKTTQEQKKQAEKKSKPSSSSIVITSLDFEQLKGNKSIPSFYQKYQHKAYPIEDNRKVQTYSQLYLPLQKKNLQAYGFHKSRESQKDALNNNYQKSQEYKKKQAHNQDNKKLSPQMGSPKPGSPGLKMQQNKKVLKHDNRKIQIVKQKAISVLQKVKSEERLKTYKNYQMNRFEYEK